MVVSKLKVTKELIRQKDISKIINKNWDIIGAKK